MYRSKLKNSFVLSFILLILILVQSIFSLLFPEIYRDNRWIVIALKGSDLTTLAIVIPSLIISLFYSRRGNLRAQIIWLGTVYFIFYSSMFYVFGTVYNKFFLIYILIFNVSALTLIKGLFNLDYKLIGESIKVTADLKKISWFIFLYITFLAVKSP